jgi:hypothetical protein
MSDSSIPEDVRVLLREHMHSFEQLEALLLMRTDPTRDWSVEELAERLRISPALAEEAVKQLAASAIAEVSSLPGEVLRYRGPREDFRIRVDRLASVYEESHLEVIMLMSAHSIERMRTGAVRAFADAFVIRRKDRDG